LAARKELPEISIESDEVFTAVRHGCRQPGIRQVVAAQLLVETELSQLRPLGAVVFISAWYRFLYFRCADNDSVRSPWSDSENRGPEPKAAVRVEARERKRLEQLCHYIARPALSDERVLLSNAGQVELKLKTPWRDGLAGRARPVDLALRQPQTVHRTVCVQAQHHAPGDEPAGVHAAAGRAGSAAAVAPDQVPRCPGTERQAAKARSPASRPSASTGRSIKRKTGGWPMSALITAYLFVLAYVPAGVTYHLARWLGAG
jgi:hypothetical protein